jgi:hypothetical protein
MGTISSCGSAPQIKGISKIGEGYPFRCCSASLAVQWNMYHRLNVHEQRFNDASYPALAAGIQQLSKRSATRAAGLQSQIRGMQGLTQEVSKFMGFGASPIILVLPRR